MTRAGDELAAGERDDPTSPQYSAWRSLVGHFVVSWSPGGDMALFEVVDAIINQEKVMLKVQRWPDGGRMWVGGVRSDMEMYSMSRRPEGGFEVAGDQFVLVGSSSMPGATVIEKVAPKSDARAVRELTALLNKPRGEVLNEW
ncbi:MAG: hypothetical protein JJU33_06165 [Phycisphaerales bacterium]|nr:hypothetical protein [Phycisphaerales bacterium]